MKSLLHGAVAATLLLASGCASLRGLGIQAPNFEVASGQPAELRLLGPTLDRPVGGAALRVYTRVHNPNPIGITLSRVTGTVRLEGFDAADADFPLGLPLEPGASAVVPLEIAISFANLPALADAVQRAFDGGQLAYSLRGTATVDAGVLGRPTFGPMNLVQGSVTLRR